MGTGTAWTVPGFDGNEGGVMTSIAFGSKEAAAIIRADNIKGESRERRCKPVGKARCVCGKSVTLLAETEEWYQFPNGKRWYHAAYGTGTGECVCGRVIVETIDGHLMALRKPDEQANR